MDVCTITREILENNTEFLIACNGNRRLPISETLFIKENNPEQNQQRLVLPWYFNQELNKVFKFNNLQEIVSPDNSPSTKIIYLAETEPNKDNTITTKNQQGAGQT